MMTIIFHWIFYLLVFLQYILAEESQGLSVTPLSLSSKNDYFNNSTAKRTIQFNNNKKRQKNLIFIYTDDQDLLLGGMTPMLKTKDLIGGKSGIEFENFFVTTPICCPSRTSLLTGKYAHNLDDQNLGWCGNFMSANYSTTNGFQNWLKNANYTTGIFGKYMNEYNKFCGDKSHVMKDIGWDKLFLMCNDNQFFNNIFNEDGKMVTVGKNDYLTSVVGNKSIEWLQNVVEEYSKDNDESNPFFLYAGLHAPHVPATPAPWYENEFLNVKAPRTPNYNIDSKDKHWSINGLEPLTDELINGSDELYRNRLRSLLSVDDFVYEIFQTLSKYPDVLENTYIVYTSDHGYNLGQFRLPSGKYHHFENNIRVPLMIRGPEIIPGTLKEVVANIDILPTFLDLLDIKVPDDYVFDGVSLKPLLISSNNDVNDDKIVEIKEKVPIKKKWRDRILIEYWGMGYTRRGVCIKDECECDFDFVKPCKAHDVLLDSPSNTYLGLRVLNETSDFIHVDFRSREDLPYLTNTNFSEFYNIKMDPYQMNNIYQDIEENASNELEELRNELYSLSTCSGKSCQSLK